MSLHAYRLMSLLKSILR